MNKDRQKSGGFTFIEVIIAVTLLAIGASVIIGLQGASVQSQLHDRRSQKALLSARRILAVIEMKELDLDFTEKSGTVPTVLSELGIPDLKDNKEQEELQQYNVLLKVEDWPIPEVDEAALKRVTLTISWSDDPIDSIELVYFIPNEAI